MSYPTALIYSGVPPKTEPEFEFYVNDVETENT